MNPNEICELCKELGVNHNTEHACPIMDSNRIWTGKFHPTNRFTPRKEGQPDKCPNCYAKMTPHEDGTSMCMECFYEKRAREVPYPTGKEMLQAGSYNSKSCPPARLPFDLDKALKGARLVTRDGQDADRFGRSNSDWCYAFVDGCRYVYNLDGRHRSGITGLDLFLAGEEDETPSYPCSKCGAPVDGLSSISLCLECQRKWKAENPFPPPPETQHQPLASMLPTPQEELEAVKAANAVERKAQNNSQDELDRQSEIMKKAKNPNAIVMRSEHGDDSGRWELCPKLTGVSDGSSLWQFDWMHYTHKIEMKTQTPAEPAGPRVVWGVFDRQWKPCAIRVGQRPDEYSDEMRIVEFIDLNQLLAIAPEVLSALKAAGIEAGGEV